MGLPPMALQTQIATADVFARCLCNMLASTPANCADCQTQGRFMYQDSLRERKKKETRDKLIYAAISLAINHGAANVRVADIANAANVSARTFNNYFSSKEEAMLDVAYQVGVRMSQAIEAAQPDLPIDVVLKEAVLSEFPDVPRKDWLSQLVLLYNDPTLSVEHRRTDRKIEDLASKAIAKREGLDEHADVFPRLAAATMIATVHVTIAHWIQTNSEGGFRDTLKRTLNRVSIVR